MKIILSSFFCIISLIASAQNTVGLLSHDLTKSQDGYNLMYPHNQGNVYLLNNCGQIVNVWQDSVYTPGNSAVLITNGDVYKAIGRGALSNKYIHAGGAGEGFEIRGWDNELKWRWFYNDSTHRPHHDFVVMPNGNLLAIIWDRISGDSAIALGRNPNWMKDGVVWGEKIIEIQPIGKDSANIVWEWSSFQHVIQNFDSTKPNYASTTTNKGRIDMNYGMEANDWLHINSIDFNPVKNQILLSVPNFNELWIIDHSTTTAIAATHSGGFGGKGGDILWRWGNPNAYSMGTSAEQKLFFQHNAHWIDLELSVNDPNYGKIIVFNNRVGTDYSTVNIIDPIFDSYEWQYELLNDKYLPESFSWTYKRPDSTALNSSGLGSVQRLDNGNTLICAGRLGYNFEITPEEEVVWEYKNPMSGGKAVSQGTSLSVSQNQMFRMTRYPADFEAFVDKDLTPKGYIELNPDTSFCKIKSGSVMANDFQHTQIELYPNPNAGVFALFGSRILNKPSKITIVNVAGKVVHQNTYESDQTKVDIQYLPNGIYFLRFEQDNSVQNIRFIKN